MANPSHDYSDDFKDIFRRLEALETYPRIPSFTNGALYYTTPGVSGGALASASAVTRENLDGELVRYGVEVTDPQSGFALIFFGADSIKVSTGATNEASIGLEVTDPDGVPIVGSFPTASQYGVGGGSHGSMVRAPISPQPGGHVNLVFSKTAGAFTATFIGLYLYVFPI